MANQKQLSNLMLLLRGGVGNVANARTAGPYQNEKSMFASKIITPKPMTTADHRAVPPTTPLPPYKGTTPVPGKRPAQGGGRAPVQGPNLPSRQIPFVDMYPAGGPGGGTRTGQPEPGPKLWDPYAPNSAQQAIDAAPNTGTPRYQGSPDPASQNYNGRTRLEDTGIPSPVPFGGPGGNTRTGQNQTPYQNVMPNPESLIGRQQPREPIPSPVPQYPYQGNPDPEHQLAWRHSVSELPPAGGDPNAPNWYQRGSRYQQTMPNAESQRTPYQNTMPNVPDNDPWRSLAKNAGGGLMGLLQSLARGAGYVHF